MTMLYSPKIVGSFTEGARGRYFFKSTSPANNNLIYYFIASSTATATATVAPTIGLLPMPIRPIIST